VSERINHISSKIYSFFHFKEAKYIAVIIYSPLLLRIVKDHFQGLEIGGIWNKKG